jgi:hypothetical protein
MVPDDNTLECLVDVQYACNFLRPSSSPVAELSVIDPLSDACGIWERKAAQHEVLHSLRCGDDMYSTIELSSPFFAVCGVIGYQPAVRCVWHLGAKSRPTLSLIALP